MREFESRRRLAEHRAKTLRERFGYRWVGLYDVTPDTVFLLGFSGDSAPVHPTFPSNAGLTAAAIAASKPILSSNVSGDPRYLTAFASTGSEIIVPVVDARGRVVGTIDVESAELGAFDSDDIVRLEKIAAEIVPLFSAFDIRPVTTDDAPALAAIYAPYVEQSIISFEVRAPGAAQMRERVLAAIGTCPWLVAVSSGDVVGYAYASPHRERPAYRWAVDTSVYIDQALRGRGIGRALYEALFELLERQGFRRACAGITLPNDASEALHRGAGFTPVGVFRRIGWKFGDWHDVLWLEREIGSPNDPPVEPVPYCLLGHV